MSGFGSENTFMYFFSTIAQSTAALAGLLFVASQFYIQFLDQKITRIKSYIINRLHPGSFDYHFNSWEATDAAKAARKQSPEDASLLVQADKLEKKVLLMQNTRRECWYASLFLIVLTFIFSSQIPVVFYYTDMTDCAKVIVFVLNLLLFFGGLVVLGWTVVKSMDIKLKNKI